MQPVTTHLPREKDGLQVWYVIIDLMPEKQSWRARMRTAFHLRWSIQPWKHPIIQQQCLKERGEVTKKWMARWRCKGHRNWENPQAWGHTQSQTEQCIPDIIYSQLRWGGKKERCMYGKNAIGAPWLNTWFIFRRFHVQSCLSSVTR